MQNRHKAANSNSEQVRYLEREGGEWKIVHSGVMYAETPPMPPIDTDGSISQQHE